MNSDSGGVDVNNFFARSRRRIEGIDGLRFTSPVTKNLSSPPRIDSTKKAYAEVLKIGLTRFENPAHAAIRQTRVPRVQKHRARRLQRSARFGSEAEILLQRVGRGLEQSITLH